MSTLAITLIHALSSAAWSIAGRLLTAAFVDRLLTRLVIAGLERLADMTTNKLDDSIVADVRIALAPEKGDARPPASTPT